jgi:RES domain
VNIKELFNSETMALPRDRGDGDFQRYLQALLEKYAHAVSTLDSRCHLGARIKNAEAEIRQLSEWIQEGVREYLAGKPQAAYNELVNGINFVYPRLQKLLSREVGSDEVGHLYRMANVRGHAVPKESLFHAPFEIRHEVGQHRYGIPGFPCLYLGGSLELCIEELRIQRVDLPHVAVAEFTLRNKLKVLDFGCKPSALATVAAGSAMGERDAKCSP